MKVFINPGHDKEHDSGAVNPNSGLRECDVAAEIGALVVDYLEAAGCECRILQSDNLAGESEYADRKGQTVCGDANDWEADVFVSIHCNAANCVARGTEVECYDADSGNDGAQLAQCIQSQIVDALGTTDRGIKSRPGLLVLRQTDMPAVLVETAFIDNDEDAVLLTGKTDEFARAIARGVTDYENLVKA